MRFNATLIFFALVGTVCLQSGESTFPDFFEHVRRYKCQMFCTNLSDWMFIRKKLCHKFCPEIFTSTTATSEETEGTTSQTMTSSLATTTTATASASTIAMSTPATSSSASTPGATGSTGTSQTTPSSAGTSSSSGTAATTPSSMGSPGNMTTSSNANITLSTITVSMA